LRKKTNAWQTIGGFQLWFERLDYWLKLIPVIVFSGSSSLLDSSDATGKEQ
jgi:hypothetical protein